MFEFIKTVFMYSMGLGVAVTLLFLFLLLSGYGIKLFSASVVWVLGMICKLTGGKI
jgi:hypothetical protein